MLKGVRDKPTIVDCNPDMIRNVVFPDVDNKVTCIDYLIDLLAIVVIITIEVRTSSCTFEVSRSRDISKQISYLPRNLGERVHGVHILPIFLCYWHYRLSNP